MQSETPGSPPRKGSGPINILPGTAVLIAVCTAVHVIRFLADNILPKDIIFLAFSPEVVWLALNGAVLPAPLYTILSPLSYAFIHGDWMHLIINMAFLLAFGSGLERFMGRRRLWLFFLLLAPLSTLGAIATYMLGSAGGFMVGASGAISGFFGAAQRLRPDGGFTAMAIFIAINLVTAVVGGQLGGQMAYIAWEAHIAGALFGYLLVPLFFGRSIFVRHRG